MKKRQNYRRLLQSWMAYFFLPPPVANKLYAAIQSHKTGVNRKKGEKENGSSMEKPDRTGKEG